MGLRWGYENNLLAKPSWAHHFRRGSRWMPHAAKGRWDVNFRRKGGVVGRLEGPSNGVQWQRVRATRGSKIAADISVFQPPHDSRGSPLSARSLPPSSLAAIGGDSSRGGRTHFKSLQSFSSRFHVLLMAALSPWRPSWCIVVDGRVKIVWSMRANWMGPADPIRETTRALSNGFPTLNDLLFTAPIWVFGDS